MSNWLDNIASRAMGVRAPALVSKKAPKGALAATQGWTLPNQPMDEPYSSEQSIDRAYMGNVIAYRCVDAIANSIVSCPFRAGDPISNNFKLNYPLARLLGPAPGSPNPMWSSANQLRYSIASYVLLGKFAWAIERDSVNRIVGLWPLRAQHVRPVPSTKGTEYFKRFEYNDRSSDNYREFKPDDIVYIWRPAMSDFRQPESPVNVARLSINVAKLLDQFDMNFLKNGGVPAHMVITPPFATPEEKMGFQEQFLSDFSGTANAGKIMFAEREVEEGEGAVESVDVKLLGTTQRDAEVNILRRAENTSISIAFGVPLSILGDSTAVTFSNAFQDRRNYWLETLLPRSREIQDGINTHLAPLLGKEVGWFDTSGVPELRPEPAIPEQVAIDWVRAGIIKIDEIRADRGLPPSKDVGLTGDLAEAEAPTTGQPAADSLAKQAGTDTVPPAKAPVATAPAASRGRESFSSRQDSTVYVVEEMLLGQVRNLLLEQAEIVNQRRQGRRVKSGPAFDIDYWEVRTERQLGPVLRALGVSSSHVRSLISEITRETARIVEDATDVSSVMVGRLPVIVDILRGATRRSTVPLSEVERALIAIHSGAVSLEDVLEGLV